MKPHAFSLGLLLVFAVALLAFSQRLPADVDPALVVSGRRLADDAWQEVSFEWRGGDGDSIAREFDTSRRHYTFVLHRASQGNAPRRSVYFIPADCGYTVEVR